MSDVKLSRTKTKRVSSLFRCRKAKHLWEELPGNETQRFAWCSVCGCLLVSNKVGEDDWETKIEVPDRGI